MKQTVHNANISFYFNVHERLSVKKQMFFIFHEILTLLGEAKLCTTTCSSSFSEKFWRNLRLFVKREKVMELQ